jgi:hypothetical protein
MDAGRIVEQGPHHDLLATNNAYARLHVAQFMDTSADTTRLIPHPPALRFS